MTVVVWVLMVYASKPVDHPRYLTRLEFASFEACDRGRDAEVRPGKTFGVCFPQMVDG